jgi:transposase
MNTEIHTQLSSSTEISFAALVALDWADQKHAWVLRAADCTRIEQGEIEHTPEAVQAWAVGLATRFAGRPIALALEQSRGALLFMLTKYEHLVLYPVHAASLARYRSAFYPSGAKDDPSDARLLLDLLEHHRDRLRRLEPDTVETRTLQFLVEERRKLVHETTRQSNRLTATLKLYFPQVLDWFGEVDSPLVGALLRRWPTLEPLQKEPQATLRQFFHQHNCRSAEHIEWRWEQIRQALPATRDAAVLTASVAAVAVLIELLATLREGIAKLDRQIAKLFADHPDFSIFDSLPGAGPALAPRLLAALGSRRERYASAHEIQCYSGIAPVIQRSGTRRRIHFRRACPKFLRQTFHEWAWHSIGSSAWARSYYQAERAKGKSHHATVRALAFKWIRILYRCWQDRTPYSESLYQDSHDRRTGPKPLPSSNPRPAASLPVAWETCGSFSKPVLTTS